MIIEFYRKEIIETNSIISVSGRTYMVVKIFSVDWCLDGMRIIARLENMIFE